MLLCKHNYKYTHGYFYCTKCGRKTYGKTYERKKAVAIIGIVAVVSLMGIFAYSNDSTGYTTQETDDGASVSDSHDIVPDSQETIKDIKGQTSDMPETLSEIPYGNNAFGHAKVLSDADTESSPTPISVESDVIYNAKSYMLELINAERVAAGLDHIILGNNSAAQSHADSMLANCFSSHWGTDGLKPYMRYSIAGGYQSNAENVSGLDYCIKPWENYIGTSLKRDISEAIDGFMQSPGHRDNILDPHHAAVNIGISWDDYNMMIVQHFEYGYVTFEELPAIRDGILSFSGTAINGAGFQSSDDLGVQIYYDPPPHNLTAGQLSRTYCYDNGIVAAALVPPLPPGYHYTSNSYTTTATPCPDPYDVPTDTPAPTSPDQAYDAWRQAYLASTSTPPVIQIVPYQIAKEWSVSGDDFAVEADIKSLLQKHGPGVYTIVIWGIADGEDVVISEHSIFGDAESPPTQSTIPNQPPTDQSHDDDTPQHPATGFAALGAKYDRVSGILNITFTQDIGEIELMYVRMAGGGATSTLRGGDITYNGTDVSITLTDKDLKNFENADAAMLTFDAHAVSRLDTTFMLPQSVMVQIIR